MYKYYIKIIQISAMFYLRLTSIVLITFACGKVPSWEVKGFQSRDQKGGRTYLFSHYEVLSEQNNEGSNPFKRGAALTDKELTITREMLSSIGQCLYQVHSDRPLSAHTPAALREMLAEAQPLREQQKYVPLTQVYDKLKDFRDLYGHRMSWYYDYIAIGGVFTALNGLFDIATHDAQAEAIRIAQKYMKSDEYWSDLAKSIAEYDDMINFYTNTRGETSYTSISDPDKLEVRLKGWRKDAYSFAQKYDNFIIKSGQAEHKLEELFGRFIYAGREVKIFGRTLNLNPLWTLKEKAGKKFVPLVKSTCKGRMSILCVQYITFSAGIGLAAAVPLAYFLMGKLNAFLHREQEQGRLLDIVGDWDNFRTFTMLKPADMKKLQKKMTKLSAKGGRDCPSPDTLADRYIDKKSGRFY